MAALMHMMRLRSLAALAHALAMLQLGKACTMSPFGLLATWLNAAAAYVEAKSLKYLGKCVMAR
jgi:hypothetical protein